MKKSIIYINFSQYDNTGRILDYLLGNFEYTAHFSFDHLRLKNGRKYNFLKLYKGKKLIEKRKIWNLRTPSFLLFPSLPFVGILMIVQALFHIKRINNRFGKFSYFFTVNGFSAWIGIIAKKLKLVDQTIFWIWDYFPIEYPDWRMKLVRWIYWQFDIKSISLSDKIAFTNNKLFTFFKIQTYIAKSKKVKVVPIGSNYKILKRKTKKTLVIGFLGMIKGYQGLDLCINNFDKILKLYPKAKLEIIGSGPEEFIYRHKARKYKDRIKFYGFIEDQNRIQLIIKSWHLGLATYLPCKSNESYWGDPSKIKTYFSVGLPVITTDVSYFTKDIVKYKAGLVVDYNNNDEFINAIDKIYKNNKTFSKNALKLAQKYNYKNLYPQLFN